MMQLLQLWKAGNIFELKPLALVYPSKSSKKFQFLCLWPNNIIQMYYGSDMYHQKIRWYLTFKRLASRIALLETSMFEIKFKVFLSLQSGNANIGSYIILNNVYFIFCFKPTTNYFRVILSDRTILHLSNKLCLINEC